MVFGCFVGVSSGVFGFGVFSSAFFCRSDAN